MRKSRKKLSSRQMSIRLPEDLTNATDQLGTRMIWSDTRALVWLARLGLMVIENRQRDFEAALAQYHIDKKKAEIQANADAQIKALRNAKLTTPDTRKAGKKWLPIQVQKSTAATAANSAAGSTRPPQESPPP
jgi:hypothetical protein